MSKLEAITEKLEDEYKKYTQKLQVAEEIWEKTMIVACDVKSPNLIIQEIQEAEEENYWCIGQLFRRYLRIQTEFSSKRIEVLPSMLIRNRR